MITHDLTPNTPEWLAYRADRNRHNASEAAAMLGLDPNCKRSELLRAKHVGLSREFSDFMQRRVLDEGHRFEALARSMAETIIGETLYSLVGSDGWDSASFDGLTLGEDVVWEHKSLSDELRSILPAEGVCGPEVGAALPPKHRIQMESQCKVSKADRALFTASKWTPDGELIEARHCWYEPDAELRADILRGWAQFDIDLAAYSPPASAPAAPVGRSPDTLPALRIELTGAVTASNLAEFKATALAAIRSVNKTLATDSDFADADKALKWCGDVEARLKAAKEHALSQTADIDALFKALEDIGAEAREVRLDLEKLVKRRKDEVREQAVMAARRALDLHIEVANAELAPMRLLPVAADFPGAIKGLRSIDSMQDALDTTLAGAKIAADGQARNIRANIAAFAKAADNLQFLFADLGQLVHKAADDFAAVLDARVAKHRADEAAREAKRQADEATRIAAAIAAEAERARKAAEAEQRAREQEAARIAEQQRQQAAAAAAPAAAAVAIAPAPAQSPPPAPPEPATLNLGKINARFGGRVMFDAAGLAMMGIEHSATDKAARLYRESDIGRICSALVKLANEVSMKCAAKE